MNCETERDTQTPEEKAAEKARWRRESALDDALRLVTTPTYYRQTDEDAVIEVAKKFAAFVEGEDK